MNAFLYVQPLLVLFSIVITSSLVSADSANTTNTTNTNTTGLVTLQQLTSFNACMHAENANGTHLTLHTTADLSTDGKLIPSGADPNKMLTEQELRNEWTEIPDTYKGDCFHLSDMTPQQLKKVYQGSGLG